MKRSDDVTKTEFEKFPGDRLYIQKEQDEKCSLAKNQPISANWRGEINIVMLQCPRCEPILERFVGDSSKHKGA